MSSSLRPSTKMDTSVILSLMRRMTGQARIHTDPHVPATGEVMTGSINAETGTGQMVESSGRALTHEDDRPFMDNDDVWKDRIWKRGRKKWERIYLRLKSWIALWPKLSDGSLPLNVRLSILRAGRALTPLELNEIIENDERKRLDAFHRERAYRAGRMLITALTNIRKARIITKEGREIVKNHVRFDIIEYSPIIYRYHVDAQRCPVNIAELYEDGICTHLSAAVMHPVRADIRRFDSFVTGLWYEVEIAGTLGIPNKCLFADLLPMIPESSPDLAFTLGYAENKRIVIKSVENLPHLLITGETLGGKSNQLNVIISCHLARNTPETLRVLMLDVKGGGIELGHYEGIKHLITEIPEIPSGIARNSHQGLLALQWAAVESAKRMNEFTNVKIKNIDDWNRKHRTRHLARIVLYIDELAELLDPDDRLLRKETLSTIRSLASTCRAAGVYIIAALQTADRTNMPQTIKNNLPGRIAFAMSDASASILAIGNGDAMNLTPVGRAIWKHGTDRVTIQTPLITDNDIAQIVANAVTGKASTKIIKRGVMPEEIIRWAIEENNLELRAREVFNRFGMIMEQAGLLRLLKGMDSQIYDVDGEQYQIIPGIGRLSRHIQKISSKPTDLDFSQNTTQNTTMRSEDTEAIEIDKSTEGTEENEA